MVLGKVYFGGIVAIATTSPTPEKLQRVTRKI